MYRVHERGEGVLPAHVKYVFISTECKGRSIISGVWQISHARTSILANFNVRSQDVPLGPGKGVSHASARTRVTMWPAALRIAGLGGAAPAALWVRAARSMHRHPYLWPSMAPHPCAAFMSQTSTCPRHAPLPLYVRAFQQVEEPWDFQYGSRERKGLGHAKK